MGSFGDPIVGGGGTLIRQIVKSVNYIPGTAGWAIEKDGDAEFNNVVMRGSLELIGTDPENRIVMDGDGGPGGTPIINMQSDVYPGDVGAGILYGATGPMFKGHEVVDGFGSVVRPEVSLQEGEIRVGTYETAGDARAGGVLEHAYDSAMLGVYVAGTQKAGIFFDTDSVEGNAELIGGLTIGGTNDPSMQELSDITLGAVAVAVGVAYSNGGANCGFAFVAPPSGQVEVTIGGGIGSNAAVVGRMAFHSFEVRAGGVVGAGAILPGEGASDNRSKKHWCDNVGAGNKYSFGQESYTVTGLVPGDTYNVRCMGRANNVADTWARFDWSIRLRPILLTGS